MVKQRIFFSTALILFSILSGLPTPALGKGRIEILPMITIEQVYDDNLFLDKNNQQSDFITTASPGISIKGTTGNSSVDIVYSPTFVKYNEFKENDTVRHNAAIQLKQQLGTYLGLTLNDTYFKTEESIEPEGLSQIQTVRRTRKAYQRNAAGIAMDYQFGANDSLSIGYDHEYLKNDDPALDDFTGEGPRGLISYWFNPHNGMELSYGFRQNTYTRDDGSPPSDDFDAHEASARYNYRFDPNTLFNIKYGLATRDFTTGTSENYRVHTGSAGINHSFSPITSVSFDAGYYKQVNDRTHDQVGLFFNALLNHRVQNGDFSLGGKSGWDEGFLDATRRGFTRYWETTAGFNYNIQDDLSTATFLSYRKNRSEISGLEDDTMTGRIGLRKNFLRWYSINLDYTHRIRNSDVLTDEYADNRITMSVSASRPYNWNY
ncbi:MAG: outer membrane beta-barrel protein [Desulfobacterales bacterium]|nr:outer membrane beta-barrel protein [Desulfobacterales bacterium]